MTSIQLARERYRTALLWQLALAGYMQAISWVPLGRWNYQPCCPPGLEAIRRGTVTTGDVTGTLAFLLPAALFGVALFLVLAALNALALGVVLALARFIGPLGAGVAAMLIFSAIAGGLVWFAVEKARRSL